MTVCVDDPFGDYFPGRWAWRLTDVLPLAEPAPARGKQGDRYWDGDHSARFSGRLLRQVTRQSAHLAPQGPVQAPTREMPDAE